MLEVARSKYGAARVNIAQSDNYLTEGSLDMHYRRILIKWAFTVQKYPLRNWILSTFETRAFEGFNPKPHTKPNGKQWWDPIGTLNKAITFDRWDRFVNLLDGLKMNNGTPESSAIRGAALALSQSNLRTPQFPRSTVNIGIAISRVPNIAGQKFYEFSHKQLTAWKDALTNIITFLQSVECRPTRYNLAQNHEWARAVAGFISVVIRENISRCIKSVNGLMQQLASQEEDLSQFNLMRLGRCIAILERCMRDSLDWAMLRVEIPKSIKNEQLG
jgi:hypothetical protein